MLFDFAAADNLPGFESVLERAREVVELMPLGASRDRLRRAVLVSGDLHRAWRYAVDDPHGIYFDEESLPDYYDRLANAYPEYEAFISTYRVIDKSGRVLYPTRETRQFLLERLRSNSRGRST